MVMLCAKRCELNWLFRMNNMQPSPPILSVWLACPLVLPLPLFSFVVPSLAIHTHLRWYLQPYPRCQQLCCCFRLECWTREILLFSENLRNHPWNSSAVYFLIFLACHYQSSDSQTCAGKMTNKNWHNLDLDCRILHFSIEPRICDAQNCVFDCTWNKCNGI